MFAGTNHIIIISFGLKKVVFSLRSQKFISAKQSKVYIGGWLLYFVEIVVMAHGAVFLS